MARAGALPQADASSLVDAEELEAKVREMYGHVAREEPPSCTSRSGATSPSTWATHASCSTRSRPRHWPRSPASATTSISRRSPRARPCSTWARGREPTCSAQRCTSALRARRRRRLHPRAGRQGERCATATASRTTASSRRGSTSCLRRRDVRRRDLERRDQPVRRQEPRLRGGGARASAGWPARPRGHRQREAAEGEDPAQRRFGRRASPARSRAAATSRRSRPPASTSSGAPQRLPLHLGARARRLQHLRGPERLAGGRQDQREVAAA